MLYFSAQDVEQHPLKYAVHAVECLPVMQDKRILQQQLTSESSARTAAEQQLQTLQRQLAKAATDCATCKEVMHKLLNLLRFSCKNQIILNDSHRLQS